MIEETILEVTKSSDLQPLQYLAATRVAISVCESKDLQNMIGRFRKTNGNKSTVGFSDAQWRRLNGKVKTNLDQIGVPHLIIDKVSEFLWPISFEIYKWILYHVEDTGIDWSPNFCWTPRANIDHEKTAEILTKNEALDVKKRFKLACIHCLDSEVRSLWDQMSLSERRSFFQRKNLKKSGHNPIVIYWTFYIQEVPIEYWNSKVLNPSYLIKFAMKNGYLNATKFFWGKFKTRYRSYLIRNCFSSFLYEINPESNRAKDHLAIACFFACQVRSDDQEIAFFPKLNFIFRYFLEWPWQKHFMVVVNRLGHYLMDWEYVELPRAIFKKDMGGFKDHDYKELFMKFWRWSPTRFKTIVNTESRIGCNILMEFVKKNFSFVFNENSSAMKAKFIDLVFQQKTSETDTYFEKENVEFFKFLVLECVATKSALERISPPFPLPLPFPLFPLPLPLDEIFYLMDGILNSVVPMQK